MMPNENMSSSSSSGLDNSPNKSSVSKEKDQCKNQLVGFDVELRSDSQANNIANIDSESDACAINIDEPSLDAMPDESSISAGPVVDVGRTATSSNLNTPPPQPLVRGSSLISLSTMVAGGNVETPASQVRSNANEHIRRNFFGKFLFYLDIVTWVVQNTAIIVVLVLNWNENECDTPLRVWCLIYGIRNTLAMAAKIAKYMNPRSVKISRSCNILTSLFTPLYFLHVRMMRSLTFRLSALLEVTLLVWFIVGNYWLFDSPSCEGSPVYILSMCLVIFSYIYLLIPFLLCMSLVFCLPFVLLTIRLMRENRGVSDAVIKKKTIRCKFRHGMYDKVDASCCICLNEYEDGVRLSTLPCKHHFHKKCVEAWLRINQSCPLCKRLLDPPGSTSELNTNIPSHVDTFGDSSTITRTDGPRGSNTPNSTDVAPATFRSISDSTENLQSYTNGLVPVTV
eukprot:CFRG1467T1